LAASSTPERARQELLERARCGERITHSGAKAFIENLKPRTLIIDPEFSALMPPMSLEEYARLEADIVERGCRVPLIVWSEVLLDGHARYRICHARGIPFQTTEAGCRDRTEAIKRIISQNVR